MQATKDVGPSFWSACIRKWDLAFLQQFKMEDEWRSTIVDLAWAKETSSGLVCVPSRCWREEKERKGSFQLLAAIISQLFILYLAQDKWSLKSASLSPQSYKLHDTLILPWGVFHSSEVVSYPGPCSRNLIWMNQTTKSRLFPVALPFVSCHPVFLENSEVMETENIALPTTMVPEGNRSMGKTKVSKLGISLSDVECDSGLILFSVFPCLPETECMREVTRMWPGLESETEYCSILLPYLEDKFIPGISYRVRARWVVSQWRQSLWRSDIADGIWEAQKAIRNMQGFSRTFK